MLDIPRLKRLMDQWPKDEHVAQQHAAEYRLLLTRGIHARAGSFAGSRAAMLDWTAHRLRIEAGLKILRRQEGDLSDDPSAKEPKPIGEETMIQRSESVLDGCR